MFNTANNIVTHGVPDPLNHSRQFAGAVIAAVRQPMLVLDKGLQVITANAAFYKTFELTEWENEGKTVYELDNRHWDIPALHRLLQTVLSQNTKAEELTITHRFSRGLRTLHLNARQLHYKAEMFILLAIDGATEHIKTEKEEKLKEEWFRKTFEDSPDCIKLLDLDGHILFINRCGQQLIEADSICQVKGALWTGFWKGESQQAAQAALETARMGGIGRFEGFCPSQKGTSMWWDVVLSPVTDERGRVVQFLLAGRDITVRKKQEQKLLEENDRLKDESKTNAFRFEQMLESLPQMAWTCTPNGSAIYQSHKWCEYTGHNAEDTFDFEWADAVHPDDLETFYASWLEAAAKSTGFFTEARIKRRDGVYRWHLVQGTPIKNSGGSIQSWVGANTDIHDKILQAEELEQKVSERTADLQKANAALERSKKQLEEFAYVSSHDLQEPLRKIRTFIGRVQQLGAGTLPAEGQAYLDKIGNSAKRMSDLINGLLDYSRLSEQQVFQGPVNLADIIAGVSNDLELLIEQKDASIKVGTLPVVTATSLQMSQLFLNLIGNALKYSQKDRSPVISITAAGLLPEEMLEHSGLNQQTNYQKIMVRDNGIGFEPGFAEQIFVIFQRLHGQCQYEGTGIGLALCKKIVTDIGGRIWATSSEGQGATFHIILPVE